MSASAYTARAIATRCFCPPDRLMPFSPISVWSPAGRILRSSSRAQASRIASYLASSKGEPKRMLSLTVAFWIQATCAVYAMVPRVASVPDLGSTSPIIADSNPDFPEPVAPTTHVRDPSVTSRLSPLSITWPLSHSRCALRMSTRKFPTLSARSSAGIRFLEASSGSSCWSGE
mmetsp:Transcript_62188/g.85478  ORF Transcript_62188/g.85478 Transcript_62188/m.85478 type:complete len:174 (-) Transcript_62188:355-876(-)